MKMTFGAEMTGIIKEYQENKKGEPSLASRTITCAKANLMACELNKAFGDKAFPIMGHERYYDIHCAEFPSPVFQSSKLLKGFARKVFGLFKKYGLTPQSPFTTCGGNHLHFGISKQNHQRAIFRDFLHRYYLPLVFMHPNDTDSGSFDYVLKLDEIRRMSFPIYSVWHSFARYAALQTSCNEDLGYQFRGIQWLLGDNRWREYHNASKAFSITLNNDFKTVEFRCVEMPRNMEEFCDQVDFFEAYVKYVLAEYKNNGYAPMPSPWIMAEISFRQAERNFYSLVEKLGLDKARYMKYVKRNLKPRWQNGRYEE